MLTKLFEKKVLLYYNNNRNYFRRRSQTGGYVRKLGDTWENWGIRQTVTRGLKKLYMGTRLGTLIISHFILVKPTSESLVQRRSILEPHSIKISLFTIFEPAILEKGVLRSFCLWWLNLQGCLVLKLRRQNRAWSKNLKRLCSSWLSPHRLPDIPQTWARIECKPGDVCQYQDSIGEKMGTFEGLRVDVAWPVAMLSFATALFYIINGW